MKNLSYAIAALLLTGCTTAPVVMKFPERPQDSGACPTLNKIPEQPKISDITTTIVKNYGTYYECSVKVDSWNEWYEKQKKIFEGVK